jgi:hypothetical protein
LCLLRPLLDLDLVIPFAIVGQIAIGKATLFQFRYPRLLPKITCCPLSSQPLRPISTKV